jgi:predicted ATPase/DNA-binding CsgD family transcriptional regulator
VFLTSFVAREKEILDTTGLLRSDHVRLLTLTGPGGVGKTRLAAAVANRLIPEAPDGIAFVGLAPVRGPDRVAPAIAQALGVSAPDEQPLPAALASALGDSRLLLVLDNFEHVLPAAPLVAALLAACPRLTILVTSRAALRVSGEHEYPVLPLALPAADAASSSRVADAPAVRLFIERATAVDPAFTLSDDNAAAVVAICARLDGLPLAIELAAARSKVLSPALLLPRLARRLPLLTGGPRDAPARLQTMREAITWSYELLCEEERALFRRLAVFVGGFTLEGVEGVMGDGSSISHHSSPITLNLITSLVDKSLLQVSSDRARGQRFTLLETIREFAWERLRQHGEQERARSAHAAYFAAFDERLDPNHVEPGERVDDRLWRIEMEYLNLEAALTSMREAGNAEGVLRLAGALAIYWHHRGNLGEGRRWQEWALAHTADTPTAERARGLAGLSLILWSQGHHGAAEGPAEAAHRIAVEISHLDLTALSVHLRGLVAMSAGAWDRSRALMSAALALWREAGLPSDEAMALRVLATIAYVTGDVRGCACLAEEALAIFRAVGHPSGVAGSLGLVARVAHDRGDDRAALLAYQEALTLWATTNARWSETGNRQDVAQTSRFPRWAGIDDRQLLVQALTGLASIASAHGDGERAAMLVGAVDVHEATESIPVARFDRALHRRAGAVTQAILGDTVFASRRAAGQRLRLDEAVALALAIAVPEVTPEQMARRGAALRPHGLTPRELDVLRLLVVGLTDREIAAALFIGHRTAQDHVSNLLGKLRVANRTEAAAVAMRDALI